MKFSNKEALKAGWQKTKENLWFIVAFQLLAYLVVFAFSGIFGDDSIISFIASTFVGFIFSSVFLRLSRGEKVDFNGLLTDFSGNKFFHYFVATLLVGLFVVAGLILLIVPGIIIGIATCFASYIIIDKPKDLSWKDKTFWRAIKESYEMTKGYKWKIFLFLLVSIGVNILGLIALVVGLLVTVPMTIMALLTIYDKLKKEIPATVVIEATPIGNSEEGQSSSIS